MRISDVRVRLEWTFIMGAFVGIFTYIASGIWWTFPLAIFAAFIIELAAEAWTQSMERMHARIDRELEWDREEWADD
jgi:uncharacterized membrane protein